MLGLHERLSELTANARATHNRPQPPQQMVPQVPQARQARLVQALHSSAAMWAGRLPVSAVPWAHRLSVGSAPGTGGRSSC